MSDHESEVGSSNIARLVSDRTQGGKNPQDSQIGDLKAEFMALRQEIARRDDLLRHVLDRLPDNSVETGRFTNVQLQSMARQRDVASDKFNQLRSLLSRLVDKLEDLGGFESRQDQSYELRDDVQRAFYLLDTVRSQVDKDHHRIDALETEVGKLQVLADVGEFQNIVRELASLRNSQTSDRATVVEMRLDLNRLETQEKSHSTRTVDILKKTDGLVADMADVKKRVVRFILDQAKKTRRDE